VEFTLSKANGSQTFHPHTFGQHFRPFAFGLYNFVSLFNKLNRMRKLFLLLSLAIVFLAACSRTNTKIKERISGSDSVGINYFVGDGKMDSVVDVHIVKNKETIAQLAEMIAEKSLSSLNKCGYDGSLHFFKHDSVIQNVFFRMNDVNCMQFSFQQDGEFKTTALTPEAQTLLQTIRKSGN
jgi:hypothetical protein